MKALFAEATWTPKKQNLNKSIAVSGSLAWKDPQFSIIDKKPLVPSPDELLIRVKYCGICGSDLHVYETDAEGYILFSGPTKLPIILGHELSGEVVEVGKEVKGFFQGDIITTESVLWCGHCTNCRIGMPNQCENVELLGLTINGGFAEYITLKASTAFGIMVGSFLNGRLSIRGVSPTKLLTMGLVVGTASAVALVIVSVSGVAQVTTLIPLLILNTFCRGIVSPNAIHSAIQPVPESAGVASAVVGFLQMLSGALASGLVAFLYDGHTAIAMSSVMALFAIASYAAYAGLARPAERRLTRQENDL